MRLPAVFLVLMLGGCAAPRLVSMDQQGGCVAIPANTDTWPCYYQAEAKKLIEQQCPAGYDIVRQEEVPVGQTVTASYRHEHKDDPDLEDTIEQISRYATGTKPPDEVGEYRIWFRKK